MKRRLLLLIAGLTLWVLGVGPLLAQTTQSAVFGTVQVHPNGGKLAIYNSLTFASGYVITPRASSNDNISFRPGSGYTGASDGSHVNGYAEMVGTSAFTFPVGDGTTLRPAGISAPPTSGTFQAAYFYADPGAATLPTGGPFSRTALGSGLLGVSSTEYWDINGAQAVNITLTWNLTSNLIANGFANNTSLITIAGWDGTRWVDLGGTATGNPLATGSITTTTPVVPDTYTAYTLARKGNVVTPPTASSTCGIVIHGPTDVEVHPGGTMAVYCDVTFVDGYVNTPRPTADDNIVFMPGTTWFDASDDSHVNGYVEKVGNTAFVFPVGDGTALRPVGMSAPASATSTLQAAYFSTNPASATLPAGAPFSTTSRGMGVNAVSPVEYWDVNGTEPVDLTFTWNPASDLSTLTNGNLNDLTMVGWDGTQWVDLGSPTTTGTLSGTGTLTVPGIMPNTYTAYTFGSKAAAPQPPTVAIFTPANGSQATPNPPIVGSATAGASVTVSGGGNSTGGPCIVTAAPDGSWTCTSLTFATGMGHTITAIASNSAGTSNTATSSFVVPSPCPSPSVGGTATFAGGALCNIANAGVITLTGQTGNVTGWETTTDNGTTWNPVANTTTSLPFTNAQNGQQYRAVVQNGAGCTAATSATVTLTTSAGACPLNCTVQASVITK